MCTRCWKDLQIPGHPGVPRCSTHGCAAGVLTGAPHSPFGGRAHSNDGEGIGTRIRNTTNLATVGGKKLDKLVWLIHGQIGIFHLSGELLFHMGVVFLWVVRIFIEGASFVCTRRFGW